MQVYPTIKEQIYNILKDRILKQELKPGEKLNIDALAREFNVSNSPIREAINGLVKDYLAVQRPNQTPEVISLSPQDVDEIRKIMQILLAGSFHTILRLDNLGQVITDMENVIGRQVKQLHANDPYEFAKTSIEFEDIFLFASGNRWLRDFVNTLNNVFIIFTINTQKNDMQIMQLRISEHQKILAAIKADDFDLFYKTVVTHYSDLGEGNGMALDSLRPAGHGRRRESVMPFPNAQDLAGAMLQTGANGRRSRPLKPNV